MTPRTPALPSIASDDAQSHRSLGADIIIANAPDPVFVSDLEGKILQANDAVSQLLGFRPDELIEQSLSRFISPEEKREFTAALREVVEEVETFLANPPEPRYDLVLMDPPYDVDATPVLETVVPWLAEAAVVMVERRTRGGDLHWPDGLVEERSRRYGEATLWYGTRC